MPGFHQAPIPLRPFPGPCGFITSSSVATLFHVTATHRVHITPQGVSPLPDPFDLVSRRYLLDVLLTSEEVSRVLKVLRPAAIRSRPWSIASMPSPMPSRAFIHLRSVLSPTLVGMSHPRRTANSISVIRSRPSQRSRSRSRSPLVLSVSPVGSQHLPLSRSLATLAFPAFLIPRKR